MSTFLRGLGAKSCGLAGQDGWAYHGTDKRSLKSIARSGLRPSKAARGFMAVFFADVPDIATEFGDTLLRFPWPAGTQEFRDGEYILDTRVTAQEIEVFTGTGDPYDDEDWVPLREALRRGMT